MMRVSATISARTGKVTRHVSEVEVSPQVVSRYQFKAALINMAMYEGVAAVIVTADALVQLAWSEAPQIRRGDDLVTFIAAQGGYSSEVLDEVFSTASEIT